MKLLRASSLLVLALVLYSANAKRYTGGGSSRGSSSGSRISWGGISKPKTPSRPISAPTSFHTSDGKTSSKTFLQSESSKPHTPTSFSPPPVRSGSHQSVPHPTGSQHASAPPAHHANNHGSGLVHEQHRQSSSSDVNSNPYAKQPAYNPHAPYVPSGGYGNPTSGSHLPPPPSGISVPTQNNLHSPHSPPYPTNQPNHPHPDHNIRPSTSFPSHSPPPYSPGPIQPHSYPNSHYAPPPYHPGSYNPYASPPGYHAPPPYAHAPPAYQAPSAPFVPGRTVYVIPESHKSSSGPGLGTYIASGVAGGVAAGATNAIVDHAISSIFRSNPSHVHTYPSAPPVGTPTSSVTNNYYYGSNGAPPADGGSAPPVSGAPTGQSAQPAAPSVTGGTTGQSGQSVGPPRLGQTVAPTGQDPPLPVPGQTLEFGTAPPPPMNPVVGTTNPGSDGQGNPSSATNGAVSKTPENQPEIPPPFIEVSDENLMKLTEELFDKQDKNLNQYVELNLQKRVTNVEPDKPVPDEAPEPLFNLKPELDSIPTITALRALYDNYQRDGWQKENLTPERRNEEDAFLDEIIKTPVMSKALDWLAEHKYIESDNFEKKDALRRMWFTTFNDTSSGFERIFLSEKFGDSGIIGMQNWLYFAHLESQKNVNYLGYVDQTSLSGKGSLLKLNYQTEGFTIQNATIFVGTAPELELSLYTVCFYARFNKWCPISIGGAKFFILTHSFRSFGKDIIDIGFPAF